ncbi:AAA family ATPase [Acidovorax sp. LjRoot118]|uniref:anticodon nuclease n=1 Tax=Acidovorax sp. LjRoot118 TaxID=3342256 RepID=UPI003ECF4675
MSDKPKIHRFTDMRRLVTRLRDDLSGGGQDFVLLYAYNGTGKTRLSMEFKDVGKRKNKSRPDTLYFNAYTEDLFSWDNDLEKNSERRLHINTDSTFFKGLKELALEERIGHYLARYAEFLFDIDYDKWTVSFRKGEVRHIKVSRGEENIFIWCVFMAICERVIDGVESYQWVKYLYIDDPITSLDDNNAIAVASDLAKLLRKAKDRKQPAPAMADDPAGIEEAPRIVPVPIKAVISSHHALFFNVVCNELKKSTHKKYFLHRPERGDAYTLRTTNDTPFFHHVAMLAEVKEASDSGRLYAYHFNVLRGILEKTATFFGNDDFGVCVHGLDDDELYARALNLMSHETYSVYQPVELVEDNKRLFKQILDAFLQRYQFELPDIFAQPAAAKAAAPAP